MVTAIITIIMFLLMVFIHELGHFLVAKASGIKVKEFALGMGPAIFKKQGKETLYSIRILPIGGYCSMEGEDIQSEDSRAFCNQKIWKRILVVIAGAVLNVVLGFIVFCILSSSSNIITNKVDTAYQDSYLTQAGLQSGDEIIEINGTRINFYPDVVTATEKLKEGSDVQIKVKRGKEKLEFYSKPSKSETSLTYRENDILIERSINGNTTSEVTPYTENVPKNESNIGKTDVTTRYILGIVPTQESPKILNVVENSAYYTVYVVKLVYKALMDLFTKDGFNNLSGPVGIVTEVNNVVTTSKFLWQDVLSMMALLTINLGVFNLLPIPALDGGRLVFLIIEAIRRKPIPADKEGMVHAIGFLLLIGLIIVITFKDVIKLFA